MTGMGMVDFLLGSQGPVLGRVRVGWVRLGSRKRREERAVFSRRDEGRGPLLCACCSLEWGGLGQMR